MQYKVARTKKIPYKIPYEYGKNRLKTFGESTAAAITKKVIPNEYVLGRNLDAILYVRFRIPAVAVNPARYKIFNFVPKTKNKKELIMYAKGG